MGVGSVLSPYGFQGSKPSVTASTHPRSHPVSQEYVTLYTDLKEVTQNAITNITLPGSTKFLRISVPVAVAFIRQT